jgi:tRNA(fMet)-specific endonuclease VapC
LIVARTGPSLTSVIWLLDTNIISELMRQAPTASVTRQFERCQHEVGLPTPVWQEMLYGVLRLPEGRRKELLRHFVQQFGAGLPKLPYDEDAARIHAELRAEMERHGRTLPMIDSQIAAIAIASGSTLVTRNLRDFEGLPGLRLVNWFADEGV